MICLVLPCHASAEGPDDVEVILEIRTVEGHPFGISIQEPIRSMPDEAIDLMALAVCIRQGRDTTILQDELGLMSTEYLT